MKNLFAAILVATALFSADFRELNWGMSPDEVISKEGEPALRTSEVIVYTKEIGGHQTIFSVLFYKDSLAGAIIKINPRNSNVQQNLLDYLDIVKAIEQSYGKHTGENAEWKGSTFLREDRNDWGLAIASGYLEISHYWTLNETMILSEINGNNYKTHINIAYSAVRYQAKLLKHHKQNQKKEF